MYTTLLTLILATASVTARAGLKRQAADSTPLKTDSLPFTAYYTPTTVNSCGVDRQPEQFATALNRNPFCEPAEGAKTLGSYQSSRIVALPNGLMPDKSMCGKEIVLSHDGKETKGIVWDRMDNDKLGVSFEMWEDVWPDCEAGHMDLKILDSYYTDPL